MMLADTNDARGYRQWQDVGRYVLGQAKAFYILGPVYVSKQSKTNEIDQDTEDKKISVLVGFHPIPVFKFEDTGGKDLPVYTPKDPPPLLEVAERFGIRVNYERLSGVYGLMDYEKRTITLATPDWTIFFHELAHALHRSFEPKTSHGQEPEAETVAQLVAATLARLYGKPDDGFSWTYITTQAKSTSPKHVGSLCMRVLDRAKRVLDLIYPNSDTAPQASE